jgi:hypothetical protein
MKIPEQVLSRMPWRKSTRSGDASNCVEAVVVDLNSTDQGA